jgi:uncharacterized membrane protein YtjA (UPF0391 family)
MLNWAATFLVISIVAALLGFTNIAGSSLEMAKVLFFVFLVVSVVLFLFGRKPTV